MKKKLLISILSIIIAFCSIGSLLICVNYKTEKYTINYCLNGGVNDKNNITSTIGLTDDFVLLPATKSGYVFEGWYDSDTNGNKLTVLKQMNKNINLYARWKLDKSCYGDFPLIMINTKDGQLPYNKEDYINCSFEISNCEDDSYNFSVEMAPDFDKKETPSDLDSVGIRLRGNSTAAAPKKPYRIKFEDKHSLLGMKKNKSWVLLADYYDQSSLRNYSAFKMSEIFDKLDFTPSPNHVVLFINDEYKGLYLLTEQVDEKEGRTNCEDDIDSLNGKEFPFLIEMDRNALCEGVTGVDNFKIDGFYPMEIKYPEYKDRNLNTNEDNVFNYITEYMNAVLTTLKTNEPISVTFREDAVSFEDLVDVDSFIDYYLLTELMFNQDSVWGSIYMHKSTDGKLMMGPVWDFDWSMSDVYQVPYDRSYIDCADLLCIAKHSALFNNFIKHEVNFDKVCARWNVVKSGFDEYLNNLKQYTLELKDVARYDANVWYGENGMFQFDMQADYIRLFLIDRIAFFNTIFNESYSLFLEKM